MVELTIESLNESLLIVLADAAGRRSRSNL
jgi:hypothetical protein